MEAYLNGFFFHFCDGGGDFFEREKRSYTDSIT